MTCDDDGVWRRDGWRGGEKVGPDGIVRTYMQADAEALADGRARELRFARGRTEIRRVDICCDVQGAPVAMELLRFVTGHRGRAKWDQSGPGGVFGTACIGSRRSDVFMRIYVKAAVGKAPEPWLERTWEGGWNNQPVTRVEVELKDGALKGVTWENVWETETVRSLWADAATRLVLRAEDPRQWAERHRAPEAAGWTALRGAAPCKRGREKQLRGPIKTLLGAERKLVALMREYAVAGYDVDSMLAASKRAAGVDADWSDEARARRLARIRERGEKALRKAEAQVAFPHADVVEEETRKA